MYDRGSLSLVSFVAASGLLSTIGKTLFSGAKAGAKAAKKGGKFLYDNRDTIKSGVGNAYETVNSAYDNNKYVKAGVNHVATSLLTQQRQKSDLLSVLNDLRNENDDDDGRAPGRASTLDLARPARVVKRRPQARPTAQPQTSFGVRQPMAIGSGVGQRRQRRRRRMPVGKKAPRTNGQAFNLYGNTPLRAGSGISSFR